jgi:hypothetical protein
MSEENANTGNAKRTYAVVVKTPSPNKHRDQKQTPPSYHDTEAYQEQGIQKDAILFWMVNSSKDLLNEWISKTTDKIIELSKAKSYKDLAEFVLGENLNGYKIRSVNLWLKTNFPHIDIQDPVNSRKDVVIPFIFGAFLFNPECFSRSFRLICNVYEVSNYSEKDLIRKLIQLFKLNDSSYGYMGMMCFKAVCFSVFGTDQESWNNFMKKRVSRAIHDAGGKDLESTDGLFLNSEDFLVYVIFRCCPSTFLLQNLLWVVVETSTGGNESQDVTLRSPSPYSNSYEESIRHVIQTLSVMRIKDHDAEILRTALDKACINRRTTVLQYDSILKIATEISSSGIQSLASVLFSSPDKVEAHIFPSCYCSSGLQVSIPVKEGYYLMVLSCRQLHIAICFLVLETDTLVVERICRSIIGHSSIEAIYLGGCLKSQTPNGSLLICSPIKGILKDTLIPHMRKNIFDLRFSSKEIRNDLALDVFAWRFSAELITLIFRNFNEIETSINSAIEKRHLFPLLQFLKNEVNGLLINYNNEWLSKIRGLQLGKHITGLLKRKGKKWTEQLFSEPDPMYIILGVFYDKQTGYLYADMSGGKRALGENSNEAAFRETEEELALSIEEFCKDNNLQTKFESVEIDERMKMQYITLTIHK